ncbi:MAG: restriction endonuclease [Deltaproteobacteria bacterium]|nr:restriction endonuclease [Deltaproteobacteria bacterium]MBN2673097.1 restriction endonuclease [Deltaproteobacteria bacterium]
MTFIEAALEILRREGAPLHARLIAEKAVDAELLSHVGKTPEQTMSKRISAAVAKGKGPFVRVKPGVFALESWKNEAGQLVPPGKPKPVAPPPQPESTPESRKEPPGQEGNDGNRPSSERRDSENGSSKRGRSRRSRNRSSRDARRDERPERSSERSDADVEQRSAEQRTEPPRPEPARTAENSAAPRNDAHRNEHGRNRSSRDENSRKNVPRDQNPSREKNTPQGFADAVENLLHQQNHPLTGKNIAERLRLASPNAEYIVDALLDADNLERHRQERRPRFVKHKSGWALSAREVPSEVVTLEENAFDIAARLSQIAERQVFRKLKTLSLSRLAQLVILVLKQMGYSAAEPVSRGREGEFHLKISNRRQGGNFYTAVVIRKEGQGRPVSDADVSALRGALHHYNASRGLVITVGDVSPEAQREADIPNLAPVGFIDGKALAREMVRYSVGVKKRNVQLAFFDESWF